MQWRAFLPLWPAVVVWWGITLPSLSFALGKTPDLREALPWPLSLLTLTRYLWPYTKCYRLGQRMAKWDKERELVRRHEVCVVCGHHVQMLAWADHAYTHFPDEDAAWGRAEAAWWTPPAFASSEDADAWIDARQDARVRGYEHVVWLEHEGNWSDMVPSRPAPRASC